MIRALHHVSLRWKFLIPCVAAIVVCMGLSTIVLYRYSLSALENAVRDNLELSSGQLENVVGSFLRDREKNLGNWARMDVFTQALAEGFVGVKARKEASGELSELLDENPYVSLIGLADAQGLVVSASVPDIIEAMNVADRDFFIQARADGFFMTRGLPNLINGLPSIIMSISLDDGNGVLFCVLDLTRFTRDFVADIAVGKQGFALVADEQGTVLAHKDPAQLLSQNIVERHPGTVLTDPSIEQGLFTYRFNNDEMTFCFNRIGKYGWTVAVVASNRELYHSATALGTLMSVSTVCLVAILSGIIFLLLRAVILKPLREVTAVMDRVSRGEVSGDRPRYQRGDEMGDMARAVDRMMESLASFVTMLDRIGNGDLSVVLASRSREDELSRAGENMVSSMNHLVAAVSLAAGEVDRRARDVLEMSRTVAHDSVTQTRSLTSIAQSMESIGQRAGDSADKAAEANMLSTTVAERAGQGEEQMERMQQAITEMSESSKAISRIIKLIDDIAFQTNILALNAAVEAARAGKYGSSFAVVAQEVRNLAAKSAESARSTEDIIRQSLERIERGASIAASTTRSLADIVEAARSASNLVDAIADASREQAAAVRDVNDGLDAIAEVTNKNSGNAERTASASESLVDQAARLGSILERFELREDVDTGAEIPEDSPDATPLDRETPSLPEAAPEDGKLEADDSDDASAQLTQGRHLDEEAPALHDGEETLTVAHRKGDGHLEERDAAPASIPLVGEGVYAFPEQDEDDGDHPASSL